MPNQTIIEAIKNRQVLRIWYEPGERIIEPHCYGESTDGNELLRAYQTSGASESGEHSDWKLFRVDRIKSITPTSEAFSGPRPEYNPDDSAMRSEIFAHL